MLQVWVMVRLSAGWTQQKMRLVCGQVWFRAPATGWTPVYQSEPIYSSVLIELYLTYSPCDFGCVTFWNKSHKFSSNLWPSLDELKLVGKSQSQFATFGCWSWQISQKHFVVFNGHKLWFVASDYDSIQLQDIKYVFIFWDNFRTRCMTVYFSGV